MNKALDYEPRLIKFAAKEMQQDAAHDMAHVLRVVKTAQQLCKQERANLWIVLPAAYLHDCFAHPKNHPESHLSSQLAADKALRFLQDINYPQQHFQSIYHAISAHSYSANITPETIEAQIVQDADRLDALGAIGIARCIQVSSGFGATLYAIDDPFCEHRTLNGKAYAIDHFFDKLFRLPESMNTKAAKKEGRKRVLFMKQYLNQLRQEII